jgi:hypothetical protein
MFIFKYLQHKIQPLSTLIEALQTRDPISHLVYNKLINLRAILETKIEDSIELQNFLKLNENYNFQSTIKQLDDFVKNSILKRFDNTVLNNPSIDFFKALRVFDPTQKSTLSHQINHYMVIPLLEKQDHVIVDEWNAYMNLDISSFELNDGHKIKDWWIYQKQNLPIISKVRLYINIVYYY